MELLELEVIGSFKEADVAYMGQLLKKSYEPSQASYVVINLSDNHVLPLRNDWDGITQVLPRICNRFTDVHCNCMCNPRLPMFWVRF